MPSIYKHKGQLENYEESLKAKYSGWEGILFDLAIKHNKAVLYSGMTNSFDPIIIIVNHWEDELSAYEDSKFQEDLMKEREYMKKQLMIETNLKENDFLEEENKQMFHYYMARAKFRAIRRQMARKPILLPQREFIDKV